MGRAPVWRVVRLRPLNQERWVLEPGIDEFTAADDDAVGEVFDALQEEFALNLEAGLFGEGFLSFFTDPAADDFSVSPNHGATGDAEHLPVVDEGAAVA